MTQWTRYPRILLICWRAAVSTELEYRLNFVSSAVLSAFWTAWAAAGVSVYFRFTGVVGGWTYPELLIVVGLFFTLNGLRQVLFDPNLRRMNEYVRRGTLDFLLTRPVDAQVLVTLRHVGVGNLLDPVLGVVLTVVGFVLSGRQATVAALGSFLLLFASAVVLLYALTLTLMALAVRLVGVQELAEVSFAVVEMARIPAQLYRDPVQTVLMVVPVAFLTTVPAQALLGRLEPYLLPLGPAVAVAALALATVLWRRSLRAYTGASA